MRTLPLPAAVLVAAAAVLACGAGCKTKSAPDDPFESGPYVQSATSKSLVVAQVTRAPSRLHVDFEPVGRPDARRSAEEPAATRVHGITLEGLEPDTAYAYQVRDAATGQPLGGSTFRTAPLPGSAARAVKIVAVGDTGGTGRRDTYSKIEDLTRRVIRGGGGHGHTQGVVAAAIGAEDPDLILHTGDVVYPEGGRGSYAEAFFRPFARVIDHIPLFPVLGNHDVKTEDGAPYLDVFHLPENSPAPERYYSFDYGPVHVVALDTNTSDFDPGSDQERWLADDLALASQAGRPPWKIAVWHQPPFSDGEHGDNVLAQQSVLPILERYSVDLVICGHDHDYQRFYSVRGVSYVVTGGGGKSLYDVTPTPRLAYYASLDHFVRLSVSPHRLDLEAVTPAGAVFDSFTLEKAPPVETEDAR